MCGILGLVVPGGSDLSSDKIKDILKSLYVFSETRGKEASGFAVRTDVSLMMHKSACRPTALLKSLEYEKCLSRSLARYESGSDLCFIGHARLATNGMQAVAENNQPVLRGGAVAVHNGIIVNVDSVWEAYGDENRKSEVDTELIPYVLSESLKGGGSFADAVKSLFDTCKGAINTAVLFDDVFKLLLATNVGSMYILFSGAPNFLAFASERYILEKIVKKGGFDSSCRISQVVAGDGCLVSCSDLAMERFSFNGGDGPRDVCAYVPSQAVRRFDTAMERRSLQMGLRRCTKCVLPETMPFIEFDEDGVCNYCRGYEPVKLKPVKELHDSIVERRRAGGVSDVLMAFSGGRDSSYAMHYLCREMGIKPVAYSYDWGMITDLARRNQARMTGKLGVEHVIISANIRSKRQNIRKNLVAWLKKPHLGMIPLLIAGDKHFFYYANQVLKQVNAGTCLWCPNNFERTQFKVGFCGINTTTEAKQSRLSAVSLKTRFDLATFYLKQFAMNPAYVNSSLIDTAAAFASYYMIPKSYSYLYEYVPWNEEEVDRVLLGEYDWEVAKDTKSTWRIGDGTASFYNYVYYTVAGFTENDTFRSNQIREGHLGRDEALRLVERDNVPRYDSIAEYLRLIDVDINYALAVVTQMDNLYGYPDKI